MNNNHKYSKVSGRGPFFPFVLPRRRAAGHGVPVLLRPLQPGVPEPAAGRLAAGAEAATYPLRQQPQPHRAAHRRAHRGRVEPPG